MLHEIQHLVGHHGPYLKADNRRLPELEGLLKKASEEKQQSVVSILLHGNASVLGIALDNDAKTQWLLCDLLQCVVKLCDKNEFAKADTAMRGAAFKTTLRACQWLDKRCQLLDEEAAQQVAQRVLAALEVLLYNATDFPDSGKEDICSMQKKHTNNDTVQHLATKCLRLLSHDEIQHLVGHHGPYLEADNRRLPKLEGLLKKASEEKQQSVVSILLHGNASVLGIALDNDAKTQWLLCDLLQCVVKLCDKNEFAKADTAMRGAAFKTTLRACQWLDKRCQLLDEEAAQQVAQRVLAALEVLLYNATDFPDSGKEDICSMQKKHTNNGTIQHLATKCLRLLSQPEQGCATAGSTARSHHSVGHTAGNPKSSKSALESAWKRPREAPDDERGKCGPPPLAGNEEPAPAASHEEADLKPDFGSLISNGTAVRWAAGNNGYSKEAFRAVGNKFAIAFVPSIGMHMQQLMPSSGFWFNCAESSDMMTCQYALVGRSGGIESLRNEQILNHKHGGMTSLDQLKYLVKHHVPCAMRFDGNQIPTSLWIIAHGTPGYVHLGEQKIQVLDLVKCIMEWCNGSKFLQHVHFECCSALQGVTEDAKKRISLIRDVIISGYVGRVATHGVDVAQRFGSKLMHALSITVQDTYAKEWSDNKLNSKKLFERTVSMELKLQVGQPVRGNEAGLTEANTFAMFKFI